MEGLTRLATIKMKKLEKIWIEAVNDPHNIKI